MLVNPNVRSTTAPPIPSARAWLQPHRHGPDLPLLDLSQAVPSYPPPPAVVSALQHAVADQASAFYTDILGLEELRMEFAKAQNRQYAADIQSAEIAITAGCNQAFCAVINTLAAHGDNVVLPLPYYFNHQMWLKMLGVDAHLIDFDAASGGIPSIERIAAAIDNRTRAIVIVTPNNPTGACYPPTALAAYYELAQRHDIALVIDETYKDFLPDNHPPHDLFSAAGWRNTLIQLFSFSKSYSLTGHRVGAVTCGAGVMTELRKVLDCTQICAPHVGQLAALAGLKHGQEFVAEKRDTMRLREQALRDRFGAQPGGFELVGAGAYFGYLRHPFDDADGASVARHLAAVHNLLLLPGSMFGPNQNAYLRIAFANIDGAAFGAVVKRLEDCSTSFTKGQ